MQPESLIRTIWIINALTTNSDQCFVPSAIVDRHKYRYKVLKRAMATVKVQHLLEQ